jgi:hypothetical protein
MWKLSIYIERERQLKHDLKKGKTYAFLQTFMSKLFCSFFFYRGWCIDFDFHSLFILIYVINNKIYSESAIQYYNHIADIKKQPFILRLKDWSLLQSIF